MTIGDIPTRSPLLYLPALSGVNSARVVVCRFLMSGIWSRRVRPLVLPACILAVIVSATTASGCGAAGGAAGATSNAATEIERLQKLVPSQSHTMQDVGFHWTNLWFAGQQGNWPLARFYFDEAHQHIQWTIQIRPIRKDPEGRDVDLPSIFQAVDSSLFAAVKIAIEQKNAAQFATAYKNALDGCYSCHKSSGKPYLHPIVPTAPAQTIIDFSPAPDAQ